MGSIGITTFPTDYSIDIAVLAAKAEETGFDSNDNGVFPKENIIISQPMIFRGITVVQISFIPFIVKFLSTI